MNTITGVRAIAVRIKAMGQADKLVALIPAGGYSSRMGMYKPLLPLACSLVIEKPIQAFYEAGIKDIRVVVGHKAELIRPVLNRLGVQVIVNPNYDRGMYSSVQAAVSTMTEDLDAFFLLPADYPLVTPATIKQLVEAYRKFPCEVVYPVYDGQRGHPPLISAQLRSQILAGEVEGGLRGLLEKRVSHSLEVPVEDAGILLDLDTEDDYRRTLQAPLCDYPSRRECEEILKDFNTPAQNFRHMQEVARVAELIAEHLNSCGYRIHTGLVVASALLHDIAKAEKDHPQKGGQILFAKGYPEVAAIIAAHMDLPEEHQEQIDEYAIVYLADKMVKGSQVMPLETRMQEMMERYPGNREAQASISSRMEKAILVRERIERVLQHQLSDLVLTK